MIIAHQLEDKYIVWENVGKRKMTTEMNVVWLNSQIAETLKIVSIAGFVTAATLVINLNFKTFHSVSVKRSRPIIVLFLFTGLIPLGLTLYFFTLLFGTVF